MMEENKNVVEGNQGSTVSDSIATSETVANETVTPQLEPTPKPPKSVGFFSFGGRMDRLSYFVNGIIAFILMSIGEFICNSMGETLVSGILYFLFTLLYLYRVTTLLVRRFHDFGKSGYAVIPIFALELASGFIPQFAPSLSWLSALGSLVLFGVSIYLLFNPGEDHENQWGVPPKKFISWN